MSARVEEDYAVRRRKLTLSDPIYHAGGGLGGIGGVEHDARELAEERRCRLGRGSGDTVSLADLVVDRDELDGTQVDLDLEE